MIQFDILTLFPEIFPNVLETSILGRAVKKNLLSFNYVNIRGFSKDIHSKVDDYPYGGGCGMLMQAQPIYDAYTSVLKENEQKPLTVFLSPRGRKFNQEIAKEMAEHNHIVLVCGHYEGIDQRVIDEISDFELSIGDYVLTGGELGAMVVCDAVSRMIPGVLAEEAGFVGESHYDGLLEYPQYTRPLVWKGREVPDVLLSGHQKKIDDWRHEQSLLLTEQVRPDLFYASQYIPSAARENDCKEISFKFVGFSVRNKDSVFKVKRKIVQKLQRKGFSVVDTPKIMHDCTELSKIIESSDYTVVVSDNKPENVIFSNPVLWISEEHDSESVFPYKANIDEDDIFKEIAHFLSVSYIVKKFSK